jgi:hypothetical protein
VLTDDFGKLVAHYFNHVAETDQRQDWKAVLTIFEGYIQQLLKHKPKMKRLYLLTDSAPCYLDGSMYYFMLVTCRENGIVLRSYHHPAEQDGKGGVDAFFGTLKRHLCSLIDKGNDVATPRQLFNSIAGWPRDNVHVEMYDINREGIDGLLAHPTHKAGVELFSRLKRFNGAVFDETTQTVEISEHHGQVDVRIKFDSNFQLTLVSDTDAMCPAVDLDSGDKGSDDEDENDRDAIEEGLVTNLLGIDIDSSDADDGLLVHEET